MRLAEIATVAKAGTIRQWHQLMLKGKLVIQKTGPGKPDLENRSTSDAYIFVHEHRQRRLVAGRISSRRSYQ